MTKTTTIRTPKRVSPAEAGRQLDLNKAAIARLVEAGELKEIRIVAGIRHTILQSSIDDFIRRTFGDMSEAS